MKLKRGVLIALNTKLDVNRGIEKHVKELKKLYNMDVLERASFSKFLKLRNKYDIIDCQSPNTFLRAYLMNLLTRTKLIITLHNVYLLEGKPKRLILRWLLTKADHIICVSDAVRAPIEKYLPKNKMSVICEFLDLKKYKKMKTKKIKNSYLFVGQLSESKGFDKFVRLSKKKSKNRYFVAGDGPLKNLIDTNQKNLRYLGFLDERDLIKWYNKVEHVYLPVAYTREGFNRCCMEALACGTKVIASKEVPCPRPKNKDSRKFAEKMFSHANAKEIIIVYNSI